jgi:hypothetical protein
MLKYSDCCIPVRLDADIWLKGILGKFVHKTHQRWVSCLQQPLLVHLWHCCQGGHPWQHCHSECPLPQDLQPTAGRRCCALGQRLLLWALRALQQSQRGSQLPWTVLLLAVSPLLDLDPQNCAGSQLSWRLHLHVLMLIHTCLLYLHSTMQQASGCRL